MSPPRYYKGLRQWRVSQGLCSRCGKEQKHPSSKSYGMDCLLVCRARYKRKMKGVRSGPKYVEER
jgi:hypothetical protein